MITQNPIRPSSWSKSTFIRIDYLANSTGLPGRQRHQLEIEGQVRLVKLLTIVVHQANKRQIDLADQHALSIVVHHGTHLPHDLVYTRLVFGKPSELTSIGKIAWLPIRIHGIIAKLLIFEQQPDHIHTEAIDPSLKPEAQDMIHRLADLLIVPIHVRLFHVEQLQVV